MQVEENENLDKNNKDFINEINKNDYHIIDNLNQSPPNIFNLIQFQTELLINFFQNKQILNKNIICPNCGKI